MDFGHPGSDWSYRRNAGNPQGPQWIQLLVLGIFLIIAGTIMIAMVSTSDSYNPYDPFAQQDKEFDDTTNAIGGVMILGGFVFIVVSLLVKNHEESMAWLAEEESPEPEEPVQERRVIQEVIKVRCRYCSTLNDVDSKHCTTCGAVL